MKLLVVFKAGTRGGTVKKTVDAGWVRVGRNASCEIHLPDPRIALEQGLIVDRDGLVYLEGEGPGVAKSTTRKAVRSVRLAVGEPIDVGPYRLEATSPPVGFDAAVTVELVHPPAIGDDLASRTSQRTLASVMLSKRTLSWITAVVVLALFLAIPAARVLDLPWKETAARAALDDRVWNPGPVMLAHQPIEAKCATCHETAFEHVRDGACLECHRAIGHHVGPALQPAALFGGARCTTCHREHKGTKATHRDDDTFCIACHRDLKGRAPQAKARNAADFARDHPELRVERPREPPNLVFPHATHVDPRGIRSPLQGRMKLECKSCHQPDASKRGFEPISMARHCQECHALQFEPAVTTREVPHGKPADAVTVIEEFYASLALKGTPDSFQKAFGVPGQGLLRRVGEPSPGERQAALALATRKTARVAQELFEVRVCSTCHQATRVNVGSAPEWKIAPVRLAHRWFPQARFDHRTHAHVACADCHDKARSKEASDVSMPAIGKCRECHGGSKPHASKITSNCMLCHGFHDERFAWDPSFQPKGPKRVAEH